MDTKVKDIRIFCPECGAPLESGFFTCLNCKLKVGISLQRDKKNEESSPPINKEKIIEAESKEIKKEEPEKKSSIPVKSKKIDESKVAGLENNFTENKKEEPKKADTLIRSPRKEQVEKKGNIKPEIKKEEPEIKSSSTSKNKVIEESTIAGLENFIARKKKDKPKETSTIIGSPLDKQVGEKEDIKPEIKKEEPEIKSSSTSKNKVIEESTVAGLENFIARKKKDKPKETSTIIGSPLDKQVGEKEDIKPEIKKEEPEKKSSDTIKSKIIEGPTTANIDNFFKEEPKEASNIKPEMKEDPEKKSSIPVKSKIITESTEDKIGNFFAKNKKEEPKNAIINIRNPLEEQVSKNRNVQPEIKEEDPNIKSLLSIKSNIGELTNSANFENSLIKNKKEKPKEESTVKPSPIEEQAGEKGGIKPETKEEKPEGQDIAGERKFKGMEINIPKAEPKGKKNINLEKSDLWIHTNI